MWDLLLQVGESETSLISIAFGFGFWLIATLLGSMGLIFATAPQKLMGRLTIRGSGEPRTIEPEPTNLQLLLFRVFGAVFALIGFSISIGILLLAFAPGVAPL